MRKFFFSAVTLLLLIAAVQPAAGYPTGSENAELSLQQQRRNRKNYITHVVNSGETLYSIAKRYGMAVSDIEADNPGINSRQLKVGSRLNIDRTKMNTVRAENIREAEPQSVVTQDTPPIVAVSEPQPARETDPSPTRVTEQQEFFIEHIVKKRETLYALSRKYSVSQNDIRQANPSLAQTGLREGDTLRIPVTPPVAVPPVARLDDSTVQRLRPEDTSSSVPLSTIRVSSNDYSSFLDRYEPVIQRQQRRMDNDVHYDHRNPVTVGLILPLKGENGRINNNFLDFYQGFLLAVDSIKREGLSVVLNVYNTQDRTVESVRQLIFEENLAVNDIIFGPVYEEQFCEMDGFLGALAQYHNSRRIALVSPLAAVGCAGEETFQMAPNNSRKYEKLKNVLEGTNVILFTTANDDPEFMKEIVPVLPSGYKTVQYYRGMATQSINGLLESDRENIIVTGCTSEVPMEEMLSRISSIMNTYYTKRVSMVTSSRIARFNNIDQSLFFKLNLRYLTSYQADRSNPEVLQFDTRYIATYGTLPTLYTYRGYDAGLFFLGTMKEFGSDFSGLLSGYKTVTLETFYRFEKQPSGKFDNVEWMLVTYTPQYTIIAE